MLVYVYNIGRANAVLGFVTASIQIKGDDSLSVLCPGQTISGELCPVLGTILDQFLTIELAFLGGIELLNTGGLQAEAAGRPLGIWEKISPQVCTG